MTERHVEIDLNGQTGKLVLDGEDITNGIQGFTLTGGYNEMPQLAIDAAVLTGRVAGQQAEVIVHLPDEAKAALVAAGWTPPPGPG